MTSIWHLGFLAICVVAHSASLAMGDETSKPPSDRAEKQASSSNSSKKDGADPANHPHRRELDDSNRPTKSDAAVIHLSRSGTAAELQILEALANPVSMEFKETPLTDVTAFIREFAKINIIIDKRGCDEAQVEVDVPVTVQLREVPISDALHIILDPLGLCFVVRHSVLIITDPQRAMSTSIYPVVDLAVLESSDGILDVSDDLVNMIESTVAPDSWSPNGHGSIVFDAASVSLVITQTESCHRDIESLLANLRRSSTQLGHQADSNGIPLESIRNEVLASRLNAQRNERELQRRKAETESKIRRQLTADTEAMAIRLREQEELVKSEEKKLDALRRQVEEESRKLGRLVEETQVEKKKIEDLKEAAKAAANKSDENNEAEFEDLD